ncbi:PPA1309 family protein [Actinophytocola glycyrrhizae]|uniref:PPA1309 family protein n=1 Tax=Actinophytocola glycyrrhizae TaxID=2044873 RepID=A0ABV9S7L5_9PSEU
MSASHAQHLSAAAREVDDFVSTAGWDQPPQLFALVPTSELVESQPHLAAQVDAGAFLTPVAQDQLPSEDLAEALAAIMWPEVVQGCAIAQEIVVLPPEAEDALPAGEHSGDTDVLRRIASEHPRRREARLVAAVLRDGTAACVLRLRNDEGADEVVEHPELAPNLTDALLDTLR